jgi:hypothetical protein
VVGCFVKRIPETKKRLKSRLLFTDFLGVLFAVEPVDSISKWGLLRCSITCMGYSY